MPRALWLPDTLRAHGLTVHETPGWQNRGSSTLNPSGVVCHHTASAAGSDHPALGTVINGRPDLNGPLCNVLLARNGDCYIIAAGTANHAGTGGWRGLSGNSSVLGIEAENNGVGEPWPAHQIDAYVRLCAAMCDGGGFTPDTVCYHREWAPTRKPDPAGPGIPSGDEWRRRVAEALTQGDAMTAAPTGHLRGTSQLAWSRTFNAPIGHVWDAVAAHAAVARAELVGLVPEAVLRSTPEDRWEQLDLAADRSIEARLAAAGH